MRRNYFLLSLPSFLIYSVGVLVPLLIGFYISLTDWNGFSPKMNFIGFENYSSMFTNPRFIHSMGFTVQFVIFNTIIQNALALLLALFIDSGIKAKNFFKTVVFIPCLLSPVLIGYLWSKLFGSIYPEILQSFGFGGNIKLLANPDTVLMGALIVNNWQWIGYWMLIYIAALQAVPGEMYEAAAIEGAGVFQKFIKITLPMIMPAVTVCITAITVGGFQVYDLLITLTGGGPGHASESFIMYVFNQAFASERAAFASANSMVYVLFLLAIASVQITLLKKREVQV